MNAPEDTPTSDPRPEPDPEPEPREPDPEPEPRDREPLRVSCIYKTLSLGQARSDETQKQRLNDICNEAFERSGGPYVENFPEDTLIALAFDADKPETIWGLAFAEPQVIDSDPAFFGPLQFHVHSIAVDQRARKNGLCKGIVKSLIQACKKKDPKAPMYLNVRVTRGDANIGGIKCYQKNGFHFAGVPPTKRDDGPNAFMVRQPPSKDRTPKRKKKKKKKTRKRSRR